MNDVAAEHIEPRTKPERFVGRAVAGFVMGAIGLMVLFFVFRALTLLSLLL